MKCRRGDVVILFYPDSNLRTGKHRPALVVLDSEIARVIGRLPSMQAVEAALRHTLGL